MDKMRARSTKSVGCVSDRVTPYRRLRGVLQVFSTRTRSPSGMGVCMKATRTSQNKMVRFFTKAIANKTLVISSPGLGS